MPIFDLLTQNKPKFPIKCSICGENLKKICGLYPEIPATTFLCKECRVSIWTDKHLEDIEIESYNISNLNPYRLIRAYHPQLSICEFVYPELHYLAKYKQKGEI
jgi:hypothetical protein